MNRIVASAAFVAILIASGAGVAAKSLKSCPMPYREIGGRCIMLDTLVLGKWHDLRNHCHNYQGELAQLDTLEVFAAVIDFIYEEGLDGNDFWIGANDEAVEGQWVWPDGSAVKRGSPFWGYWSKSPTVQEPNGGTGSNYACMLARYFYYFHDCHNEESHSPICEYVGA